MYVHNIRTYTIKKVAFEVYILYVCSTYVCKSCTHVCTSHSMYVASILVYMSLTLASILVYMSLTLASTLVYKSLTLASTLVYKSHFS